MCHIMHHNTFPMHRLLDTFESPGSTIGCVESERMETSCLLNVSTGHEFAKSSCFGYMQSTQAVTSMLGALVALNMWSITFDYSRCKWERIKHGRISEIICSQLENIQRYCIHAHSFLNVVKCCWLSHSTVMLDMLNWQERTFCGRNDLGQCSALRVRSSMFRVPHAHYCAAYWIFRHAVVCECNRMPQTQSPDTYHNTFPVQITGSFLQTTRFNNWLRISPISWGKNKKCKNVHFFKLEIISIILKYMYINFLSKNAYIVRIHLEIAEILLGESLYL